MLCSRRLTDDVTCLTYGLQTRSTQAHTHTHQYRWWCVEICSRNIENLHASAETWRKRDNIDGYVSKDTHAHTLARTHARTLLSHASHTHRDRTPPLFDAAGNGLRLIDGAVDEGGGGCHDFESQTEWCSELTLATLLLPYIQIRNTTRTHNTQIPTRQKLMQVRPSTRQK